MKTIFSLYVDGKRVNSVKIWYGGPMGHDSINLSYGIHLDRTDNSINEMITYDIDDSKELKLKMANILGSQNALTPKEIVREVWKNNILHSIR